ncbi:putative metal-binding motif-containing protein [Fulvivirga sp. M361]|uniref:putative metal-binding motif-containing protein n=1 Tax=Fulvivirga sp. M361 TaxID=2594266 RepID=UPI0016247E4E|nr:putative metal-binding motif-containing protein [Fulvivirga sp. M361]
MMNRSVLFLAFTMTILAFFSCSDDDCIEMTWYEDADGDGFGNIDNTQFSCDQPEGFVSNNADSDDNNALVNPDATEVADNEIDENGDGFYSYNLFFDNDNDGFGAAGTQAVTVNVPNVVNSEANTPQRYSLNDRDCNDSDASINPNASEVRYNGIDNNCDGAPVSLTFVKEDNADWTLEENQDRITENTWITRQDRRSIFNIADSDVTSTDCSDEHPVNTEWAFGTTKNIASLEFGTFLGENFADCSPPSIIGREAVLHIIDEDIYIDIKFLSWTRNAQGGGFSYIRSN